VSDTRVGSGWGIYDEWDRRTRCHPCCGAHVIRHENGVTWLEHGSEYGEEANLEINYCPHCGKKPEPQRPKTEGILVPKEATDG